MVDETINKQAEPEITKIDLGFVEKRKFEINGDISRILELNVSDLNAIPRYNEAYPKLEAFMQDVQKELAATEDKDDLTVIGDTLVKIDREMRKCIDYIFDTNASEVCAPSGNMFDPIGGQFRYERIVDVLSGLYSSGISSELKKMKDNAKKYTSKYSTTKKSNKK